MLHTWSAYDVRHHDVGFYQKAPQFGELLYLMWFETVLRRASDGLPWMDETHRSFSLSILTSSASTRAGIFAVVSGV